MTANIVTNYLIPIEKPQLGGNMGPSPHKCPLNAPRGKRSLRSDPKFPLKISARNAAGGRTPDGRTSVFNADPILPLPYGGQPWQEYLLFNTTLHEFRLCYGMTNPPGYAVTIRDFRFGWLLSV